MTTETKVIPLPEKLMALDEARDMLTRGEVNELSVYRQAFMAKHKRDTKLVDDALLVLVATVEDANDGADYTDAQWADVIFRFEDEKPAIETEEGLKVLHSSVHSVAAVFDNNAAALADALAFVQAPEDIQFRPASTFKNLNDDPDVDLDAWPLVGTKRIEGSNQPYDIYRRTANDGTPIDGSWYDDTASATAIGKAWIAELEKLEMAEGNIAGALPEYAAMSSSVRTGKIDRLNKRLKNLANLFRKVRNLYAKLCDVKDHLPNVAIKLQLDGTPFQMQDDGVNPVRDAAGNMIPVPDTERKLIEGTNFPFYIQDITNPSKTVKLAVGELLKYKVDAALKKGGNQFDALRSTAVKKKGARGKNKDKTGAEPTSEADKGLLTIAEFRPNMLRLHNLLDPSSKEGIQHQQAIVTSMAKWSDDEVLSFFTVYTAFDSMYVKSSLQERVEKLTGISDTSAAATRKPAKTA